MDVPAIDIVFGGVISKQTQIEKIRSARQKFERCKISFVEWSGIRPHPANAMLFQKPDELWPMPSGVTKFDCETEIPGELTDEIAQHQFAILWREGRWKLNEDHTEFCSKRFDGPQK